VAGGFNVDEDQINPLSPGRNNSIRDLVGRSKTTFRTFQGSRRGGYTVNGSKLERTSFTKASHWQFKLYRQSLVLHSLWRRMKMSLGTISPHLRFHYRTSFWVPRVHQFSFWPSAHLTMRNKPSPLLHLTSTFNKEVHSAGQCR
jgi:hypothetical protein